MRPARFAAGLFLAIFALSGLPAPAGAQSTYVGASLTGDIVRTSHVETDLFDVPGGGEALGFAVRVGRAIGSNWGVELEYARPSMIEHGAELPVPLPLASFEALTQLAGTGTAFPSIYPIPGSFETRERHATLSTVAWVTQNLSARVALVYLGGLGFNRLEREYGYDVVIAGAPIAFPSTRTIEYSTRPVVGFESWIGLTDHLTLIPSVRLHGIQDGWLLRPSGGLAWSF
jgi:hypothetical protein